MAEVLGQSGPGDLALLVEQFPFGHKDQGVEPALAKFFESFLHSGKGRSRVPEDFPSAVDDEHNLLSGQLATGQVHGVLNHRKDIRFCPETVVTHILELHLVELVGDVIKVAEFG